MARIPVSLLKGRISRLVSNRKLFGAAALTASDVAGKAVALIIMPYLANRMGSADFGVLNLYMSVIQILTFGIELGGPALITAEYVRNGYASARRLRATNLRLAMWISIAMILVSLSLSWFVPSVVPTASGVLIVVVSCVQAINVVELSYYRGAQTYAVAIAGQFVFAFLNVLLTVMAFEFDSPTVANRLICIALAGAVVQTVYALELRRKRYTPADKATRRANTSLIVGFGLSISIHVVSGWIRVSIDRFFVAANLGLPATGVYGVAVSLTVGVTILFGAVSQQLQPFLYRRVKCRDFAGFRRVQFLFVVVVLCFTTAYYLLLQMLFGLLFANEYDGAKALLPALLGGAAAQSIFTNFSHAAFYERRASEISWISAIALLVHIAALGGLALSDLVTSTNVALVYFVSSTVATLAMAWLSRSVIRQLRRT